MTNLFCASLFFGKAASETQHSILYDLRYALLNMPMSEDHIKQLSDTILRTYGPHTLMRIYAEENQPRWFAKYLEELTSVEDKLQALHILILYGEYLYRMKPAWNNILVDAGRPDYKNQPMLTNVIGQISDRTWRLACLQFIGPGLDHRYENDYDIINVLSSYLA